MPLIVIIITAALGFRIARLFGVSYGAAGILMLVGFIGGVIAMYLEARSTIKKHEKKKEKINHLGEA